MNATEKSTAQHLQRDGMATIAQDTRMTNEGTQSMMEQQRSTSPHNKPAAYLPLAGSYLTPPTDVVHSFSSEEGGEKQAKQSQWGITLPPFQHHTPPTSPENPLLPRLSTATSFASHDPTLFPDDAVRRSETEAPLFPQEEARPTVTAALRPKPVEPSATFPAILNVTSPAEALQYWEDRRAELRALNAAMGMSLPRPQKTSSARRDNFDQQLVNKISRHAGVIKTATKPKVATRPKAAASASPALPSKTLQHRRQRSTPKARSYSDSIDGASPSAQQGSKHRRAPPSKKTEGDNRNWRELVDYAPPASTLDTNVKPLKVNWHGNSVDLSKDPDRNYLHPQELAIAASLRLSCEQYLTNKRKIFQGRLQALKDDKNFTKTRAQGSCSIDVNKASQLWEAFDKAGWFERKWFEQYL